MTASKGWFTRIAIGCASIMALVIVVAAVLVTLNWSTMKGYYQRASSAMSSMMHVIAVIQTRFGGAVSVNVRSQTNVQGAILSVTVVNPPWLGQVNPDGASGTQKAREIAIAARDALPPNGGYEHYEIVLARSQGSVVKVSRTWVFRFEARDLMPTPEAQTPPPGPPGPKQLLGVWRGTSTCTDRVAAPACNDESVVYRFTSGPKPGLVRWAADKIVDGKLEPMGEFDLSYDAAEGCWKAEYHSSRVTVWRLSVDGMHLTGSGRLMPGNETIRKLDLRKD